MGSACSAPPSTVVSPLEKSINSKHGIATAYTPADTKPVRNSIDSVNHTPDLREIESDTRKIVETEENPAIDHIKLTEQQKSTEMEDSNEGIENKDKNLKEDDNAYEKESEKDENEADDDDEKKQKMEPLTEEELEELKKQKYADLKNIVTEVYALQTYRNEVGEYDKLIRNACVRFYNSYFALAKRTSLKELVNFRLACAHILIETKIVNLFCDIATYIYTNGWSTEDGKKNELKFGPLSKSLLVLLNFTDCSDDLAVYLAQKHGFLELLAKILKDYEDRHLGKTEPKLKGSEDMVLNITFSIIHNLSLRETNIARLRSQDFTHLLQPYLESSKAMYRLNVLASLAGIVNEEECEIISTNKSVVAFLMKVLGHGLKDKRHRHRGWSCMESGRAIRTLARNDANKKLLVELGALELLVELGQTENTAEQYESAAAIWTLCFDKDNRTLITSKPELGVVEVLMELGKLADADIKKASMGALWTLRDDLTNSPVEKYMKIGNEMSEKYERHKKEKAQKEQEQQSSIKDTGGHVMISYNWAHQETLKTIRDRIKDHGFKVWMDIDQMGGSTLQAMADAVEGANVILMCMSNKYKSSPACRAEAEYAFQTRKKIIPLKMEAGYNADGWLGFILGAKLFFDFSGKYPFEDKMKGLLKELDAVAKKVEHQPKPSARAPTAGSHNTQQLTASSAPVLQHVPRTQVAMGTVSNVRNWSSENVRNWIERNDLIGSGLERMTGSEIAYLAKMQVDAPEFFHKFIYDTIKAKTVSVIAKIGWALHDLSTEH